MEKLPIYIHLLFALTTLLTIYIYYRASLKHNLSLFIIIGWMVLQSFIVLSGFYQIMDTMPPRIVTVVLPPLLLIVYLFSSAKGRVYINALDVKFLTLLHIVRIPVEIVLLQLYINMVVPKLMTFEGINYDILSGVTAPFIYYFGYIKNKLPSFVILIWNFVCLGLLINIVYHGIFSAPTLLQKFAFEQPNIALFYFPFIFLPGLIVPLVLFSHLVSIKKLLKSKK